MTVPVSVFGATFSWMDNVTIPGPMPDAGDTVDPGEPGLAVVKEDSEVVEESGVADPEGSGPSGPEEERTEGSP